MNGGSPPTEPKARTGELTPPGINCSARFCNRRETSSLRDKEFAPRTHQYSSQRYRTDTPYGYDSGRRRGVCPPLVRILKFTGNSCACNNPATRDNYLYDIDLL